MHPLVAVTLAVLNAAGPQADGGVAPHTSALRLGIGEPQGEAPALKAKALLEPFLSKALGQTVQVVVLARYDQLSGALLASQVDVAWVTPIAYVTARSANDGVKALAKARRNGASYYRTAFIVRNDSPARSLADLRGKRVAWVDRGSGSGYLYPRALLARAGQDPDKFFSSETLAGSHPAVCKAVREGVVDVGATLCDQPARGMDFQADGCVDVPPISDFRVVAASEPIPNDVIAARPGLDALTGTAVTAALLHMGETPEGRAVLTDAFRVEGWATPTERDFEAVRGVLKTASTPFVPVVVPAVPDASIVYLDGGPAGLPPVTLDGGGKVDAGSPAVDGGR